MGQINYKEYINSMEWKEKRTILLSGDKVKCYCCEAEKWQYRIWRCNNCNTKFYGDKWDFEPFCDCEQNDGFTILTDGGEFFQLHHLTYKNLGNEAAGDLIIVCEDCHRLAHHLIRIYSFLKIDNVIDYIRQEKIGLVTRMNKNK